MEAHQFTGIWRKWQDRYNPEDSQSRDAFLTANLARTKAKLIERAIKRKEAEATGSLPDQHQPEPGDANTTVASKAIDATCNDEEDLTSVQHEVAETDEQEVPVLLSHRHEQYNL